MIVTLARNCLKPKLMLQKSKRTQTIFSDMQKKFCICKTDIGPLLNCSTNSLINDKYEMCCLLVDQFTSVITTSSASSGCSAASNWQPGPHAVSTIVCSSWNPSCC